MIRGADSIWSVFIFLTLGPEIAFGLAVLAIIGSLYLVLRK